MKIYSYGKMTSQELDEAVARKLGYEMIPGSNMPGELNHLWSQGGLDRRNLPPYSTDIKAAWEIVEFLTKSNYQVRLEATSVDAICEIRRKARPVLHTSAEISPMAICKAFLAMEEK